LSSVTIPGWVTNIGEGAFNCCYDLAQVTLSNGVGTIGECAFYDTDLTSITIPNSVTSIGSYAFFETCLSGVTIPGSVTNIGEGAFYGGGLTAITVSATNPFLASVNGVLFNKSETTILEYPGGLGGYYVIPSGVTSIGDYAFWGSSKLGMISIPASVTNIGDYAFCQSSLESVTIPGTVTGIGVAPFTLCPTGHHRPRGLLQLHGTDECDDPRQRHQHWEQCVLFLRRFDSHHSGPVKFILQ
jgi:hypothetical protein